VLAVLPTGFGKSLIYQILPGIFDFVRSGCEPERQDSVVLVVSPLSALMRDQLKKLEAFLNVCILQSIVEDEGEQKATIPKNVNKCSLVFAHPEVYVDNKSVAKMLKRKEFNRKVQAIVVDEAHLVLQW
jgi:ATP-dependent DNA helicase RecQ